MNKILRNFPKPPLGDVHADCGLSQRREIVARICNRTNEICEYVLGLDTPKLFVPGQSNIDERMPLMFLRPCIEAINAIIEIHELTIDSLPMPGNSIDYHGFVPLTRSIIEKLNAIIEEL
jgi:hypothetical protein